MRAVGPRGVPAQFDRATTHRRGMLAKVHIAKVQLRMSDDDYGAVLLRVAGQTSAKDCTDRQLDDVLREFKRLGFEPQARSPRTAKPADHPVALKARALWISLHHLCAIADPSEKALEAFARRQLRCDRLQWANQSQGYRLIEALKAIAARHGWNLAMDQVKPEAVAIVTKRRLVDAIAAKLRARDIVPDGWSERKIARQLTGIEIDSILFATGEELDRIAQALGAKLRAAMEAGV